MITTSTARPVPTAVIAGIGGTLAFAALHVYWAAGGRLGVPPSADAISSRPVFLAYDLAAAIVLVAAAGVARLFATRPTPALTRLVLIGAAVALVRGGIGVVQAVVTIAAGDAPGIGSLYDAWFVATGALFWTVGQRRISS